MIIFLALFANIFTGSVFAATININVSRGETGGFLGPLDSVGNDYCPTAQTEGCDFSATDNIVRTHDKIEYKFAVGVDATGDNLILETTLKPGLIWGTLPGVCNPYSSSILGDGTANNPSKIICDLEYYASQTIEIPIYADVMGDVPNAASVGVAQASLRGQNSSEVFANLSALSDTIVTAKPHYNLRQKRYSGTPASIGDQQGYRLKYRFWVETTRINSNGNASDDRDPLLGNEKVANDLSFLVDLSEVSANAFVEECETFERDDVPFAIYQASLADESVLNAGTTSCDQTGEGVNSTTVRVSGADLSLNHYPTKTSSNASIDSANRIASYGLITVFIPIQDISEADSSLVTKSTITDFAPVSITGQTNFAGAPQDSGGGEWLGDNEVTVSIENIKGAYSHSFRCYYPYATKPEWCTGDWFHAPPNASARSAGDGAILPLQPIPSYTYYGNLSFFEESDVELCSIIDTRYMELYDIEGKNPVTCWGACTNLGQDHTIEYGVGYESTSWQDLSPLPDGVVVNECDAESTGWYNTLSEARAHGEVSRIRIKKPDNLAAGKSIAMILSLRAKSREELGNAPAGTLLKTWSTHRSSYTSPELRECNYESGTGPESQHVTDSCGDRMHLAYGLARIDKTTEPNNIVDNITAGGTVTYNLQPSLSGVADGLPETLRVIDTLPAGGEYVDGTAIFGGIPITPTISGDVQTGQTLEWDLGGQEINGDIPAITFDMFAPLDISDGTVLTNVVTIESETDNSLESLRTSTREVSVTAPASMLISTRSNAAQISSDGQITYEIEYLNSTSGTFNEIDVIDILPFNGDNREPASNFSGTVNLVSLSTESTNATFYVSADLPESMSDDPTDASHDRATGSVNWCATKADFTIDPVARASNGNTGVCPSHFDEVTAIRLVDNQPLGIDGRRKFSIILGTADNFGGDSYSNYVIGAADLIALGARSGTVVTTIIEEYDLGVAKTITDQQGLTLNYQLRVENSGNTPFDFISLKEDLDAVFGAGNYLVTEPPSFLVEPASQTLSLDANYSGSGEFSEMLASGGTLEPQEHAIINLPVEITRVTDRGAGAGVYHNSAQVSGVTPKGATIQSASTDGPIADPDNASETVLTVDAEQSMTFTQTKDASALSTPVQVGEIIHYTLNLENTGNMPFENAHIELPHLDASNLTNACDFLTGTAMLDVQESAACEFDYALTQEDVRAGSVTHQAEFINDDGAFTQLSDSGNAEDETGGIDPNFTDFDNALVEILQSNDLTNLSDPAQSGDQMLWQIEVYNPGETALTTLTLTPNITSADGTVLSDYDLAFISATGSSTEANLQPGDRQFYTLTRSLTQDDIDQGLLNVQTELRAQTIGQTEISDLSDDPQNSADIDANGDGDPDDPNQVTFANIQKIVATQSTNFATENPTPRAGDEVIWQVDITNEGNTTLHDLTILPEGTNEAGDALTINTEMTLLAQSAQTEPGILQPGESERYQWSYTLTQNDVDAGAITLQSKISLKDPQSNLHEALSDDPDNVTNQDSDGDGYPDDKNTISLSEAPQMNALKTHDASYLSAAPKVGDILKWELTLTNTGNVTLSGISIEEELEDKTGNAITLTNAPQFTNASQGSSQGTLRVGETATYLVNYELTQSDVNAGGLRNLATFSATTPQGNVISDASDDPANPADIDSDGDGNPDDPTVIEFAQAPALGLTHQDVTTGFGETVRTGDVIEWFIEVKNTGNVTLGSLELDGQLADNLGQDLVMDGAIEFVSASANSAEGMLEPDETARYRAQITITQTMIENGAVISTFSAQALYHNDALIAAQSASPLTTALTHRPELSINNADDIALLSHPPQAGDELLWDVQVTNSGNVALTGVTLSHQLRYPDDEQTNHSVTISYLSSSAGSPEGALEVGETATYQMSTNITQHDIDVGALVSQVQGSAIDNQDNSTTVFSDDPDGSPEEKSEPTVTSLGQFASFGLSAFSEGFATTTPRAGDEVVWQINMRNSGNISLHDFTFSLSLENADGTARTLDGAPRFIRSSQGSAENDLLGGEIAYYELRYALTQDDIESGGLILNASAQARSETDISVNAALSEANIVNLPQKPKLQSSLVDDLSNLSSPPQSGERVNWTLTVKNTGNVALQNLRVGTLLAKNGSNETIANVPMNFVGNDLGTPPNGSLAVGETATFEAEFALTSDAIAAGAFYYWAQSSAQSGQEMAVVDLSDDPHARANTDYNGDGDPDDPTFSVFDLVSKMELIASADTSALSTPPQMGETVTWRLILTNTGNVNLNAIKLYAKAENGFGGVYQLSTPIFESATQGSLEGKLKPHEQAVYTLETLLNESDIESGSLTFEAAALADGAGGALVYDASDDPNNPQNLDPDNDGNPDDPTVVTLEGAPSVQIEQSATLSGLSEPVRPGDIVEWDIKVKNTGNVSLNAVNVEVLLKDGQDAPLALRGAVQFISADQDSNEGELKLGESAYYKVSQPLTQALIESGAVQATSNVSATGAQGINISKDLAAPERTLLPHKLALSVLNRDDISALSNPPQTGDILSWSIELTNLGNVALMGLDLTSKLFKENGDIVNDSLTINHLSSSVGSKEGRLEPGETGFYQARIALSQNDMNAGALLHQVTVSGFDNRGTPILALSDDPDGDPARQDEPTRTLLKQNPDVTLTLKAEETAPDKLHQVGQILHWQGTIRNHGNVSIFAPKILHNLQNAAGQALTIDASALVLPDQIAPDESFSFDLSYSLTTADIESGALEYQLTLEAQTYSGDPLEILSDDPQDMTNQDQDQDRHPDDPTRTVLTHAEGEMALQYTLIETKQILPRIYSLTYRVMIKNDTDHPLTNLTLENALADAVAPGFIQGTPILRADDLPDTLSLNTNFDGSSDQNLLSQNSHLDAGAGVVFEIQVTADFTSGIPDIRLVSQVTAKAEELNSPVLSDDPALTPDDPKDKNPAIFQQTDSDQDGMPNEMEGTSDHDQDGVPDHEDFDPMGYLYCENDGSIIKGAELKVTGPEGAQQGVGRSNNIHILHDGSSGMYQFFVSKTGLYEIEFALPEGVGLSNAPTAANPLALTSLLPENPVYYGSSADQSGETLMTFSKEANPYAMRFLIEEGSPFLLNNNIPLSQCTSPDISIELATLETPKPATDDRFDLSFEIRIENTGDTTLENLELGADFEEQYGASNFVIQNAKITDAQSRATRTPLVTNAAQTIDELIEESLTLASGETLILTINASVINPRAQRYAHWVEIEANALNQPDVRVRAKDEIEFEYLRPAVRKLEVTKKTPLSAAHLGDQIPYEIAIHNPEKVAGALINIHDELPKGLYYLQDSALLNGKAAEPEISDGLLVWRNVDIGNNEHVILTYKTRMASSASGGLTNRAYLKSPEGEIISNIAEASVEVQSEPAFACSDLIGKVFVDFNANGTQEVGERGVADVALVTIDGQVITTDHYGRYSLPCVTKDALNIGQNFVLKLDPRSLPIGYVMPAENPKSIRLTAGKMGKLNFALTIENAVTFALSDKAFEAGQTQPKAALEPILERLISVLNAQPSVLLLNYKTSGNAPLETARLAEVEALISRKWKNKGRYTLTIETRILNTP